MRPPNYNSYLTALLHLSVYRVIIEIYVVPSNIKSLTQIYKKL